MKWGELIFGKPISAEGQSAERIGPARGVPMLGLDALSSSAYGPEAAMTVLLLGGVRAGPFIVPIMACIIGLLALVCVSYRQTIRAYPDGGGSYTVARENLGGVPGLIAAAALCVDYVLTVAVGISAGVGALVSAVPVLQPRTLSLCLAILALLTLLNVRGVRSTGGALAVPTYLFLGLMAVTLAWGIGGALMRAHDFGAARPAHRAGAAVGSWLLLRSFASGCTALTGVEAVSNATPLFKEPRVSRARTTLTTIVAALIVVLAGVAFLSRALSIEATPPDTAAYRSVLSQVVERVAGRNVFYYVTMAAIVAILSLSANTSFADFPRVCRLLALDQALPLSFAHRGPRLVYTRGILVLALLAATLLVVFGGITERLIPLFAIGAFIAFTFSQLGMVFYWRRHWKGPGAHVSVAFNAAGALATGATCLVIAVAKFTSGAWITVLVIPLFVFIFRTLQRHRRPVRARAVRAPMATPGGAQPLVIVPVRALDPVERSGLALALRLSADVEVVQVLTEDPDEPDLRAAWRAVVQQPLEAAGVPVPRLTVIRSRYRELFEPLLEHVLASLQVTEPRQVIVVVPERVHRRWWDAIFGSHRASIMRDLLLLRGGPRLAVVTAPWYEDEELHGAPSHRASRPSADR